MPLFSGISQLPPCTMRFAARRIAVGLVVERADAGGQNLQEHAHRREREHSGHVAEVRRSDSKAVATPSDELEVLRETSGQAHGLALGHLHEREGLLAGGEQQAVAHAP